MKKRIPSGTIRMSVGETARLTGLSRLQIYGLIARKELKLHSYIDGKYKPELRLRLYLHEVERWLSRQPAARLTEMRLPKDSRGATV